MDKFFQTLIDKLFGDKAFLFLIVGILIIAFGANGGYPKYGVSIPEKPWGWAIIFSGTTLFILGLPSASKIKSTYGIEIDSPQHATSVYSPIQVEGKFKKRFPTDHVYAIEYYPDKKQYWPKERLTIMQSNTWRTTMHIGSGNDQPRKLIIAFVGENSLRLIEYYKTCKGGAGISLFPTDFHPLAEIVITLLTPKPPAV